MADRVHGWRAWSLFVLWSIVIYVTIPVARLIRTYVTDHVGREAFGYLVAVIILVATAGCLVWLSRRSPRMKVAQVAWLIGSSATYLWMTYQMRAIPEEALHFVEYGILAIFAFSAAHSQIGDRCVYVAALLLCLLVGTVDEIIQWAVPERYFDWRDVRTNALGSGLALVGLAMAIRPPTVKPAWSTESVGWLCDLAILQLLVVGLCLSNTPPRVEAYAGKIPALAFLGGNPVVMNEFGYSHVVPGAYTFQSRLTLDELHEEDRERADEAAAILDTYAARKSYSPFLQKYTPGRDPFLHEARVHLFSRNEHIRKLTDAKRKGNEREIGMRCTAAYRENQILETHFSNTLHRSQQVLKPSRVAYLEAHYIPEFAFTSAVSRNLLTRLTEAQSWALLLGGVVFLGWLRCRAG